MKSSVFNKLILLFCFVLTGCYARTTTNSKNFLYSRYKLNYVTDYSDDLIVSDKTIIGKGENYSSSYFREACFLNFYNLDKTAFYYDVCIEKQVDRKTFLTEQKYVLSVENLYFCKVIFEKNSIFDSETIAYSFPNYWLRIRLNDVIDGNNKDLLFEFWFEGNNTIK